MLPVVAAAAAIFSFFFGGCTSRKPVPQKNTSGQGLPNGPHDHYVAPRVDPMDKFERRHGTSFRY